MSLSQTKVSNEDEPVVPSTMWGIQVTDCSTDDFKIKCNKNKRQLEGKTIQILYRSLTIRKSSVVWLNVWGLQLYFTISPQTYNLTNIW